MRSLILSLLLVLVTASTAVEFSVEEKFSIVSLHNKIRQNVEPPATTMPDLVSIIVVVYYAVKQFYRNGVMN